jgi:hypothetical protein
MKWFDGENSKIIIFSSDNVKFKENEKLLISKEDWYIDHHLMSICDYLIGPHSTFTLWASFIGKNTYFSIRDASGDMDNTVSDFRENDLSHVLGAAAASANLQTFYSNGAD